MATKRIRCTCGKIYDSANQPVCPECQSPPPFVSAPPTAPSEPLPEVPPEKRIMLDSDRKKRPWLYVQPPKKIVLYAGLSVLVVAGWFILRPHAKPHKETLKPVDKTSTSGIPETKSSPTPNPNPLNTATPAPVENLPPISLTASADLAAEIARARPGTTFRLAAGKYRSGFIIEKSVHLIGEGTDGAVNIQSENNGSLSIQATGVILENILCSGQPGSNFAVVKVLDKASLELRQCVIDATSQFGLAGIGTAKIVARKTTFSTRGQGTGCILQNTSFAELSDCLFTENRWGFTAQEAAQSRLTGCQFEKNGQPKELGYSLGASGAKTYLEVAQSTFTDNFRGVVANEASHISVKNCIFKNNGVPDKPGNVTFGTIGAQTGGQLLIKDCTLESNRQGIVLYSGSSAKVENCTLIDNGMVTKDSELNFPSNALSATGKDTKLSLYKTNIRQSPKNGINLVDGANLAMEDCEVSGARNQGLVVDSSDPLHSEATVVNCRFLENKRSGISIYPDSVVKISKSIISRNEVSGVYIAGNKATIVAEECEIAENGECGALVLEKAFAVFASCKFTGNLYGVQNGTAKRNDGAGLVLDKSQIVGNTGFGVGAFDGSVTLTDCSLSKNKKNFYRAGGLVFENWSGEKPASADDETNSEPTGQTGGKTGVEPSQNDFDTRKQSASSRKKQHSSEESRPRRETNKADEILRNVLRYIPR